MWRTAAHKFQWNASITRNLLTKIGGWGRQMLIFWRTNDPRRCGAGASASWQEGGHKLSRAVHGISTRDNRCHVFQLPASWRAGTRSPRDSHHDRDRSRLSDFGGETTRRRWCKRADRPMRFANIEVPTWAVDECQEILPTSIARRTFS